MTKFFKGKQEPNPAPNVRLAGRLSLDGSNIEFYYYVLCRGSTVTLSVYKNLKDRLNEDNLLFKDDILLTGDYSSLTLTDQQVNYLLDFLITKFYAKTAEKIQKVQV